ncbi:hypothetical protein AB0L59_40965 [Streptomyces sp. NPDC052109]|uniref:hypothetical protein n=1 Tax=Streptomyces sp. NPDC052109 TaxID=3155527 RepID=UPI0034205896
MSDPAPWNAVVAPAARSLHGEPFLLADLLDELHDLRRGLGVGGGAATHACRGLGALADRPRL